MRTRTFKPSTWLAAYAAITALLTVVGAAVATAGIHWLARAAVGAVLVYGTVGVARVVPTARAEGQPADWLRIYYQATTTVLFTAWAGWVAVAGLTNPNVMAFCGTLVALVLFGLVFDVRPSSPVLLDKPASGTAAATVDRVSTRLADVTVDVVEYGDAADWRFLITFPSGAQHLLAPDANAYRVARHIVRHQRLETDDSHTP